eukprot:m51a1_g5932 putative calmodulin (170) ;mRNA; r:88470-89601
MSTPQERRLQRDTSAARAEKLADAALADDQVSEFKEAFEMFSGGKPSIPKSEAKQLFRQYGIRVTDEAFEEAFNEADSAQDGKIDFPEFVSMMSRRMRQTSTEEKLLKAFRVFDPENKGFIPTKELTQALTTLGNPLSTKELGELLTVAENNQGEVKYDLFINTLFMKK